MTVLVAGRFEEHNVGQVAGSKRVEEIMAVVLMVCTIGAGTDRTHARRPLMGWVGRARVVLERLVMGNVIDLRREGVCKRRVLTRATGRAVRIRDSQIEPAFEPSPGQIRSAEQIADVGTGEMRAVASRASVAGWLRIVGQRSVRDVDAG